MKNLPIIICPNCENPYAHISKQGRLSCEDCGYSESKMKEVWIKKTVYKRLLVCPEDLETIKVILSNNMEESFNYLVDAFDKNDSEEYDNEVPVIPFEFIIQDV